jgi:hypothetical protein
MPVSIKIAKNAYMPSGPGNETTVEDDNVEEMKKWTAVDRAKGGGKGAASPGCASRAVA